MSINKNKNNQQLLRCANCKFWQIYDDVNIDAVRKSVDKKPYGTTGLNVFGSCLKTVVLDGGCYGVEKTDSEMESMAFGSIEVDIPRIYEVEEGVVDPIGKFIDGAPFEDLLARRIEGHVPKLSINTWLTTRASFACNQAIPYDDPCEAECVHCTFADDDDE